ncbi:MAG: UvrD-helicase domain-containing protein [Arcobacteraceae bacterium]|jgi:DNA helicase-2/ATP-dependent DNA helicase PcrA|nr:UvrD-helicase domain-containing protein [Arcobacteraceae bacterium]
MALSTIEEIYQCIDNKESFILDAGAGSGKTWSLIESLKYIIKNHSEQYYRNSQKIVCITYTNVAKNEIIERLENNGLVMVSTIHDFLWSCISQFKKELKIKLIEVIEEKIVKVQNDLDNLKSKKGITFDKNLEKKEKLEESKKRLLLTQNKTQYKNYFSYENNIISHDEVVELSSKIFSSYPVIRKIVADSYPVIFVDEYQDTFPKTINILLDNLLPTNRILFGFYGDKLQKIYDTGIGEIPLQYKLKRITKSENYRCSTAVVDLLNKIRDDIKQIPSGKNKSIQGSCTFYQNTGSSFDLNAFINSELKDKLKLLDSLDNLKVLYLTHKLIARENNYEELYNLVNKNAKSDALTKKDEDRCPFIKFLYQIEDIALLHENSKTQSLLRKVNFDINFFEDKKILQTTLDELMSMRKIETIGDVYRFAIDKKLLQKSQKIDSFDLENENNKSYYDELMNRPYKEIIQANKVADEQTPFSTKHGTKGAEFENVLVVIDDDAWRNYSFDKYFSEDLKNENIYNRTKNLFYVVCSRAKVNLSILALSTMSSYSELKIKELFGEIKNV